MSVAREGNQAKRVCSETRSASPGDLCCARGVTHTGYAKVGDSRVFLPLNAWQINWIKNVAGFARSEALVYGARLKTTPISEINLLEVKSEDPRAEVVFTMDTSGAKYVFDLTTFRIRGKLLTAQWAVDPAWVVHSGVYLFPKNVVFEYDSLVVGEFTSEIKNGDKILNYLNQLADRRFSFNFSIGEIVLEENNQFKRLWQNKNKAYWVAPERMRLIDLLHQQTDNEDEESIQAANQISMLEKSVLDKREEPIKSSELDSGKKIRDLKQKKKDKQEEVERSKFGEKSIISSTRIGNEENEDPEMDEEMARKILKDIQLTGKPATAPSDNDIKGLLAMITKMGKKFEGQDLDNSRTLSDVLFTAEGLKELLNKPSVWTNKKGIEAEDDEQKNRMAAILRELTQETAPEKPDDDGNPKDWRKSTMDHEKLSDLVDGTASGWGGRDQW